MSTIKGIDISSYQSAAYSTSGLDFVLVKATEGRSYVNPRMADQAARARRAGLVLGFYHFLHPGNLDEQAAFFVERCDSAEGDILAVDWESTGGGVASCAEKDAFLRKVKALRPGHRVILYCNRDFWLNRDTSGYAGDGLWIAAYGAGAGAPGVRADWLIHQYTDDPVDTNVARFSSRDAMRDWARGGTSPSGPGPTGYEPFPCAGFFRDGPDSPVVTAMGRRLVAEGCSAYAEGPGPRWSDADRRSYAQWQRKLGYSGADADGWPGRASWEALKVPRS
ncbi:GH25 family lysozyme [Streptomyces sp. I05A-00742]|uniref:GH25 family lysozyme n=1 Tax=Streptomyces sp. I05A-00742 TaxID=2732853 RepID=UPI001488C356|nr:GH25 family lysozyme [Streptomyces sp. I05A-00742]